MTIFSFSPFGYEGSLVTVEVDLRRGIPAVDVVGLADNAVKESRERMKSAIRNSGFEFPMERVLISLSPADLKKEGAGFDLALALAVLAESAKAKSGLDEAVIVGTCNIDGQKTAIAVMDFEYMGGSMGSVVGEKITRILEYALENKLPSVVFTASGGARMQESALSLMQMAKTSCIVAKLNEAGLLYITVLTEPTFGGVTASFGTIGDIIIAEKGARIGFAGRRVIEQTIRQKLPADFQTAEYLLKFGQIDFIVERKDMKEKLSKLIRLHTNKQ